jgi:multicomponent Na+:H+ antiporter subunit A
MEVLVDIVIRTAAAFSLYLLFSGHNAPGGGFIAGLVAGICVILMYVARGGEGMNQLVRVRPDQLLGVGLAVAVGVGGAGWLWGGSFLETAKFEVVLPLLGTVKTTSALVFDIGVFLVVLGLVAALIGALGDEGEDRAR